MPSPPSLSSRAARHFAGLLLLALLLYAALLPLRPEAWGGPRRAGPFEDRPLPAPGWLARDARLAIERFATARSPDHVLEGTAEGLLGFHALLIAGRYALLAWALRGAGSSDLLAVLGTLAAFAIEAVHGFVTDDSNVGLLMFVGLLVATARPALSNRTLVVLALWFTLWANAHPSAVLGLVWLGVLAVGRTVEWWRGTAEGVGRWWLALGLGMLAACVNPDGPRLFVDALTAAKNPNLPALPAWQPIDFSTGSGRPYVYLASLAALVVVQLVAPRGFTPTTLLVLLTFGVWPLLQQRGLGYWGLVLPWLAAPYLGPLCGTKRLLQPSWAWAVWVAAALAATPTARWAILGNPRPLNGIVSTDTEWRFAITLKNGGASGTILCGPAQGDFLAWALDGDARVPVAVYTRPETIDRDLWGDAHRALNGDPDWWDALDRLRANWVVIDRDRFGALADRLRKSDRWAIVRITEDYGRLLIAERRELLGP
jgi:hypothetical protein